MRGYKPYIILILLSCFSCTQPKTETPRTCFCEIETSDSDSLGTHTHHSIKGALLGTRFKSFEELKSVVQIEYYMVGSDTAVQVRHCSNGIEVVSVLEPGVSQGDISKARDGSILDRLILILNSPYTIANRADLERAYILLRRMPSWFGAGDVAFYDLAESSVKNIITSDLAFKHPKDSSEKGYLNSFNHITAQAFLTSFFSVGIADFVADAHERHAHPQLLSGNFSFYQIKDLAEGPLDNYADIVNNEWGQELGKQLKIKYNITERTELSPTMLAHYLNDLQTYYSWAFRIGFKPFKADDKEVVSFANKMNFLKQKSGAALAGISSESSGGAYFKR